ncbi:iron-containing alcohol dehydrogenase [Pseudoalteromonas sp. BDTF-M6]|uniref:iron-containing alcohol dehydrogenase n=1 Tax=Pseudoalteromonas sp. BDTF-M6 TaxID=2796132 RepID=UPI001BB09CDD|nr:iron-containing alcohol dehydrogenase [Pseudoalteromonas sp. BDTF-M6]MBS3797865.1 iron-containing alcohol dehydrogenase [Pseudoalteromonas sp. BDTF-M6]
MAAQHLFYRMYHLELRLAAMLLPIPEPHVFHGDKAIEQWLAYLRAQKCQRILLVSDPGVLALDLHAQLKEQLLANDIEVIIFSELGANPSIEQIEQGVSCYQAHRCDTLLAIGGGSAMDCAKLIAARIARPNKSLRQMQGLFKVLRTLPPVYVVPTTAGTGSEVTVVAVVSDTERKIKFSINDLCLVPKGVLFLPELTTGLPPGLTASTGIDALTHALEAYIGINANAYTRDKSEKAVALILDALPRAYHQPQNLGARTDMLWAAMYAGQAFTRTSVGYVHAIAHQLGAVYGLGHGLANALVLRPILEFYGDKIDTKLERLAKHSLDEHSSAAELREKIYSLLDELAIPHCIADLKAEDIPLIAKQALAEAHPDYPVPCFMTQQEMEAVLRSLIPNNKPNNEPAIS